jgi:hypothetical protein
MLSEASDREKSNAIVCRRRARCDPCYLHRDDWGGGCDGVIHSSIRSSRDNGDAQREWLGDRSVVLPRYDIIHRGWSYDDRVRHRPVRYLYICPVPDSFRCSLRSVPSSGAANADGWRIEHLYFRYIQRHPYFFCPNTYLPACGHADSDETIDSLTDIDAHGARGHLNIAGAGHLRRGDTELRA